MIEGLTASQEQYYQEAHEAGNQAWLNDGHGSQLHLLDAFNAATNVEVE